MESGFGRPKHLHLPHFVSIQRQPFRHLKEIDVIHLNTEINYIKELFLLPFKTALCNGVQLSLSPEYKNMLKFRAFYML